MVHSTLNTGHLALLETYAWITRELLQAYVICTHTRPRGYKTFFVLNSAEHEIYPAHKC